MACTACIVRTVAGRARMVYGPNNSMPLYATTHLMTDLKRCFERSLKMPTYTSRKPYWTGVGPKAETPEVRRAQRAAHPAPRRSRRNVGFPRPSGRVNVRMGGQDQWTCSGLTTGNPQYDGFLDKFIFKENQATGSGNRLNFFRNGCGSILTIRKIGR